MPIIGHIIFAIFGQRYRYRLSNKQHLSRAVTYEQEELDREVDIKGAHKELFAQQSVISHRGVYKGDIEIFKHGNEAFDRLFEDLEKAKKFIHMHYYIIKPGEIYEHLKSILIKKADEGVEVRFIIDDFGR